MSGQLEGELGATAFGDIYTFGPTFRAENSNTARHLAEFWMIEPEMAFYDLEDNANLAEEFIKYLIQYAMDNNREDLDFLAQRLAEEEKQLKELDALTAKIEENQKKREQNIAAYKKQMETVADEKKTWKARETELRAQDAKAIEAIRGLASQETAWTAKKKTYEGEAKKWAAEVDKQEKISETYQGLKENK